MAEQSITTSGPMNDGPVVLKEGELIKYVNELLQRYRTKAGTPNVGAILGELGWNKKQWLLFNARFGKMLTFDQKPCFAVKATPATEDPTGIRDSLVARGINPDQVAAKLNSTFGQMRKELLSMGMSRDEVAYAIALKNHSTNQFASQMEMVSSGGFVMNMKFHSRIKEIEERLDHVRDRIRNCGDKNDAERQAWVDEECKLMQQYTVIGKLLLDSQKGWYDGAAQLALVRSRVRQDQNGFPKKMGKPGFTPRVMVDVQSDTIMAPSSNQAQDNQTAAPQGQVGHGPQGQMMVQPHPEPESEVLWP